MTDPSRLLARLAAHLGAAHVLTDPVDLAPHLTETRGLRRGRATRWCGPPIPRGSPSWCAPAPRRGCRWWRRWQYRACRRRPAAGGHRPLPGAPEPPAGGRSRQCQHHGGGRMVLADVQAAAAEAGMLFPLSLASEGSCRIGGNLSTNAGGTAVLAYGNARDLVLGLEVVLADGRVWNGLKGLRKDNAGYDLKHLFLGSEGTLGLITRGSAEALPPAGLAGRGLRRPRLGRGRPRPVPDPAGGGRPGPHRLRVHRALRPGDRAAPPGRGRRPLAGRTRPTPWWRSPPPAPTRRPAP